jgi:hypothetical protein
LKESAVLSNSDLWQRIQGFEIDNPNDTFPFSARLARDGDWSPEKARVAIEEYKRFIYLSCVAAAPLAPPKAVSQVWHCHILDTRSYWTDLCEGVLGRPIHHDPAERSAARAYHPLDLYAEARSLYEREFGCTPPVEFWPPVCERSVAAADPRADDRGSWIAPEPSGLGSILWCSAAALLVLLASCGDAAAAVQADTAGGGSRGLMLLLAAVVALARIFVRGLRRTRRDGPGGHRGAGGAYRRGCNGDGYWGCEG